MKLTKPLLITIIFLSACSYDSSSPGIAYSYDNSNNAGGDQYNPITENPFINVRDSATSTFSIDADGGSYLNCIRYINEGGLPPADAIRTEEFINYFSYSDLTNFNGHPIASKGEIALCPWNEDHQIVYLKISGKELQANEIPASNIVFLVDVSGSMSSSDKLNLIKSGMKQLRAALKPDDKFSIVTYAGDNRVVLEPTNCSEWKKIHKAIDKMNSGGGTNGADGIKTAYTLAEKNLIQGGNNRIILCSDGDFNVGITNRDELIKLIEEKRKSGIYLTTVGVGHGNLNDGNMEQLANNGNGNYEYIGNEKDATRVFHSDIYKFYTVAEDVKVQITFNPDIVESYRLIGYENRLLNTQDFTDDSKDAGELSSAQSVVAMYEIVPNSQIVANKTDPSFNFLIRYKNVGESASNEISIDVANNAKSFINASSDLQFAAGLSAFALVMRDSPHKGNATYALAEQWVSNANLTTDPVEAANLVSIINRASGLK